MSSKLFLFTKDELIQIQNPSTKAIGISGSTWEEAMRFMISKQFGNLATKLDNQKNPIGYEVSWLEKEEQDSVSKQLPEDVFKGFQVMNFDESFINTFIEQARSQIRNIVK